MCSGQSMNAWARAHEHMCSICSLRRIILTEMRIGRLTSFDCSRTSSVPLGLLREAAARRPQRSRAPVCAGAATCARGAAQRRGTRASAWRATVGVAGARLDETRRDDSGRDLVRSETGAMSSSSFRLSSIRISMRQHHVHLSLSPTNY